MITYKEIAHELSYGFINYENCGFIDYNGDENIYEYITDIWGDERKEITISDNFPKGKDLELFFIFAVDYLDSRLKNEYEIKLHSDTIEDVYIFVVE